MASYNLSEFLRKNRNVKLVNDVTQADIVIPEEDLPNINLGNSKKRSVYIAKKETQKGGLLPSVLLLSLFTLLAPFFTFSFLPLWGKFLVFISIAAIFAFEIESIINLKKSHFFSIETSMAKKSGQITNILFVLSYIIYAINTNVQKNKYGEYNYVGANFTNSLIVLGVSIIFSLLFATVFRILYYKFKKNTTFKNAVQANKAIFIILITTILLIVGTTVVGITSGEVSSSEDSILILEGVESCNTNDTGITLCCNIKNNTAETIYKIKSCKFTIEDLQGNIVAEKTFENLYFESGWVKKNSSGKITLDFSFPNEAKEDFWKNTEKVSIVTTISEILLK